MLYKYEGRDINGVLKRGTIEADNPKEAKEKLKERGIVTISTLVPYKSPLQIDLFEKKLKPADVLEFTQNLKALVGSGIPLLTALEALRDETENKRLKKILSTLIADINNGVSFAQSISKFKDEFGEIYVGMLEVAEETGNLEQVLERIAEYYEKQIKLKNTVKKAMTYPIIVIVVLIAVLTLIMYFVIPQFASIYEGFGSALPAPTQMLINASNWFKQNLLEFFGGLVLLVVGIKLLFKIEKVKHAFDKILFKLPVFGKIVLYSNLANFARTLSSLIESGVELYNALETASKTIRNTEFKRKILEIRDKIKVGKDLSLAFKEAKIFPNRFILMVSTGSKTGRLDEMLKKTADFYEEELEKKISRLTTMIEPALMVIIGGIIGFVLVALYLPIFNMGSVISK